MTEETKTKTTKDYDYSKLAENTYTNCETYRKLENKYLRGFKYEYSISADAVEVLQETIQGEKELERFCTNKAKGDEFDKQSQQDRDDHMSQCPICKPYWEALQVSRQEYQDQQA